MTRWHYLSILVLSAILAFLIKQAPPGLLDHEPEFGGEIVKAYPSSYLIKTKTTQYNLQGEISHILTADKIRYYENQNNELNNIALLDQPRFTFFEYNDSQSAPWKARSDQGRSDHKGDEFILKGDVVLSQKIDDKNFSIITTDQLLIKPKLQYAETDKPVMIKNHAGTTSSIGLKISLDNGIVELLSTVRSQYDPH